MQSARLLMLELLLILKTLVGSIVVGHSKLQLCTCWQRLLKLAETMVASKTFLEILVAVGDCSSDIMWYDLKNHFLSILKHCDF